MLQVCLISQLGLYAASVKVFALGKWIALLFFVFKVNDFKAELGNIREIKNAKRGENKAMGKTGKDGNKKKLKYQFQKYTEQNVSPFLFSWEYGKCEHLAEDRQCPESLYEWCDSTTTKQACVRTALPTAQKCYILENKILIRQKSTRVCHWFLCTIISYFLLSLTKFYTDKNVSPLLSHITGQKEVCHGCSWLFLAAAVMHPWRQNCNLPPCCGLTWPAATHHTAVCSPFPLPLWAGGENQEKK